MRFLQVKISQLIVLIHNVTDNRIRLDFYSMSDGNLEKFKEFHRDLSYSPPSNGVTNICSVIVINQIGIGN